MATRETSTRIVRGPARIGRRTKDLTSRLRPGDVAVIDHVDLDRVAAEGLVGVSPAAVINAAPSVSGVELPAVIVAPSPRPNTGLSLASFSTELSGRRFWSRARPRYEVSRSSKNPRS